MDPTSDPADLWARVQLITERALAAGALRPIVTEERSVEQAGVGFVVRMVSSLDEKHRASLGRSAEGQGVGRPARSRPKSPFLPYEPALFVAEISATHVALLNKFPVIPHHLLLVTRVFEDQETALTVADFEALAFGLAAVDGLGFYNGGAEAGASQAHKHLQLVPLPLASTGPAVPIEPLLDRARGGRLPGMRFRHALASLPSASAAELRQTHGQLCRRLDLDPGGRPAPYNLLVTRSWMLLVPRTREHAHGISVNALGFAGSLFVRDSSQLATIRRQGPMTLLERVAVPD